MKKGGFVEILEGLNFSRIVERTVVHGILGIGTLKLVRLMKDYRYREILGINRFGRIDSKKSFLSNCWKRSISVGLMDKKWAISSKCWKRSNSVDRWNIPFLEFVKDVHFFKFLEMIPFGKINERRFCRVFGIGPFVRLMKKLDFVEFFETVKLSIQLLEMVHFRHWWIKLDFVNVELLESF